MGFVLKKAVDCVHFYSANIQTCASFFGFDKSPVLRPDIGLGYSGRGVMLTVRKSLACFLTLNYADG